MLGQRRRRWASIAPSLGESFPARGAGGALGYHHCPSRRVRGSFPGLGGLKETKMFLPHPLVKLSIAESLRDREVACSTSDLQGLNFESFVLRAVSSTHPTILRRVSWPYLAYNVHKSGLRPDSFHFLPEGHSHF